MGCPEKRGKIIQRAETEKGIGRTDTRCLCKTTGRKIRYSGNWTLNAVATQRQGDAGFMPVNE